MKDLKMKVLNAENILGLMLKAKFNKIPSGTRFPAQLHELLFDEPTDIESVNKKIQELGCEGFSEDFRRLHQGRSFDPETTFILVKK